MFWTHRRRLQWYAATLIVVGVAACGSQHPTAPSGPTNPPPVTPPPPPAIQLNWAALGRLYDDPLFRQLPMLLENQPAASPLNVAVERLVSAVRARDYDLTRSAMLDLAGARQTYGLSTSTVQSDRMLLVAISLFELRGWGYINAATGSAPLAGAPATPVEPAPGL